MVTAHPPIACRLHGVTPGTGEQRIGRISRVLPVLWALQGRLGRTALQLPTARPTAAAKSTPCGTPPGPLVRRGHDRTAAAKTLTPREKKNSFSDRVQFVQFSATVRSVTALERSRWLHRGDAVNNGTTNSVSAVTYIVVSKAGNDVLTSWLFRRAITGIEAASKSVPGRQLEARCDPQRCT